MELTGQKMDIGLQNKSTDNAYQKFKRGLHSLQTKLTLGLFLSPLFFLGQ